ncbi:Tetratricopeptide-like helical domain superfamily [Sesbania bispinosa]|nr:Tetratricopeptide-like helical domain superfamily [Sesbania bispinosa]
MDSRVFSNPKCWQLRTLYSSSPPFDSWKIPCVAFSFPLRHVTENNNTMPCCLVNGSVFSGSRYLRLQRVKRACSPQFDDFHHEEMMNMVQDDEIAYAVSDNIQNRPLKNFSMKPDLLEPSLLGIQPEPPSWPEREEILRLSFERKVNSVGIPLSIRMIKKKLQFQEGVKEASELTHCSVKKTFSSMLFILHELQNHALQTRETLCCEDLQSVIAKLQREMDASFVWLFQQVFWKTPTLMVNVMVLLANFSVFSMSNNTVSAVTPSSKITKVLPLTNNKSEQQHSQVDVEADQVEGVKEELTEDEEILWNFMLEEASTLQTEWRTEVLDHEMMQLFMAPVSVELEGDQYEEYVKTELYYKKHLRISPNNSLLLSNYAQFLFLVAHDIDGAEEYHKRSVLVESPEAEAFCRYADFLWLIRKDLWAAELRYHQALEADPGNTYYLSKYASFLWNNGGQDTTTTFPLEEFDNLQL